MGTSGTFGGSKSDLIPSWVDEPPSQPVVAPGVGAGGPDDAESGNTALGDGPDPDAAGKAPIEPTPYAPIRTRHAGSGLASARGSMTRGARTADMNGIRRGAGRYVRSNGGGRATARRMSNSRAVAGGVAALARAFAADGPTEALLRFNLQDMAGAPAEDVFVALTDMICPAGATIDEAIARDAMLETIADLAAAGVGDFDGLSADDLREFFIGVVSRSIEGKIINEVGTNTIAAPSSIAGVERAQSMLHDFVDGCVRDEFDALETDLGELDAGAIDTFVYDLYSAALELVEALGAEDA